MTGSRLPFVLVTLCYQAFTLSDGALRMLVLLHLHQQGRTPLALALVLLPYEIAGVLSNLLGGWLGARFGLKRTLLAGLSLQVLACTMLAVDAAWLSIPYVMASQVLSGVAKDLVKTSAKSYVKQLAPDATDHGLFRLVAATTGSKNAMKGLGFFAGGALLAWAGFAGTNLGLALLLAAIALLAARLLPVRPGRREATLAAVLRPPAALRWLALARAFLFGSRDVWFAVALPVFLAGSLQWSAPAVGGLLAAWVIGYGAVQAAAPALLRPADVRGGAAFAAATTLALLLPLGVAAAGAVHGSTAAVIAGLAAYGAVFASTSSLHSWLAVALAGSERTAERVGFYYAANSAGRLCGTLGSGWLFGGMGAGGGGLAGCLLVAAAGVVLAAAATLPVRRAG